MKSAIAYGFKVFSTTSIQASHLRKLTHLSGKKDDPSDAKIHAIGLQTRPDIFCEVVLNSEDVEALKLLCNLRDGLIEARIDHENKLPLLKQTFPALHHRRIKLNVQWVLRLLVESPRSNFFVKMNAERTRKRLANDRQPPFLCGSRIARKRLKGYLKTILIPTMSDRLTDVFEDGNLVEAFTFDNNDNVSERKIDGPLEKIKLAFHG